MGINLERCSYSHNSYHAWDSGLIPRQKTEQAKEKMSIGQKKYFKTHSPWNKGKRYHIKPKEKLQENDEK